MGVLDAFLATWSRARATFGQGVPEAGSSYDASSTLLALQAEVALAQPGRHWTGLGSDAYGSASERQAAVLGDAARLDRQLRAEVDKSAEVVAAGRRELDGVRQWVLDAAAGVPPTAEGDRMLYPVVSRGSGEIVEILERSAADMRSISTRIGGIGAEYQALGGDLKLGTGDGGETREGPLDLVGDSEPWTYPFDPPPPADSAPGGGRWEFGQPYPPGPGGGPPMGPMAVPTPWHRSIDPPVVGGTSSLQEVVAPRPNGWGVEPAWTLQEAYRFRVTGEGYNGGADHTRWVQRDGMWHQATWIGYDLQAEHVRAMVPHNDGAGYPTLPWGANEWSPVNIQDIYAIQVDNPRLPLYIPDPFGRQHEIPLPSAEKPAISGG